MKLSFVMDAVLIFIGAVGGIEESFFFFLMPFFCTFLLLGMLISAAAGPSVRKKEFSFQFIRAPSLPSVVHRQSKLCADVSPFTSVSLYHVARDVYCSREQERRKKGG